MIFYIGVLSPYMIRTIGHKYFMYSFRQLWKRKSPIKYPKDYNFFLDSGGFMFIRLEGDYPFDVQYYLEKVSVLKPDLFVNMDYMCEPSQREILKLNTKQCINKTIDNNIKIFDSLDKYGIKKDNFVSVIQGWEKSEYIYCVDLLKEYGMITKTMGVSSICRRKQDRRILSILTAIHNELPNVNLHGFGIKISLLKYNITYSLLHSCDSMSWCLDGAFNTTLYKTTCNPCIHPNWKRCSNCETNAKKYLIKIKNKIESSKKQSTLLNFY